MVLSSGYLETPSRQAAVTSETEHRPWPLPAEPWVMAQTWEQLLFAHWPVPAEQLSVPAGLRLDSFEGSAWLGVTPFRLTGLRLRGTLPLPGISSFLELNVRTYVTAGGKPGIWFFSLDASSRLAVEAARRAYRLPYHEARISAEERGELVDFRCARRDSERPYVFDGSYRAGDAPAPAKPGTLEHFLTERYCLYAEHEGELYRADIHHPPWPLRPAEAEIELNTMPPDGISLGDEPLLHLSERQDVVLWPLRPV